MFLGYRMWRAKAVLQGGLETVPRIVVRIAEHENELGAGRCQSLQAFFDKTDADTFILRHGMN